ncbi:MAG: quinone-dependent dihydroorotate dehydrogenase [Alphaproteobacteria bacterium]|nr:quinone-dependent dihydroorotate dehydrogenase [Alphaproteobacteria bacterium]
MFPLSPSRLLHLLSPETAHGVALRLLSMSPLHLQAPAMPVQRAGIKASNPVGLAAGFDRHGEAVRGALGLGFGFIEIGGVTPKPQPGNPKPRLFRLTADRAIINRMGFYSHGADAVARRLDRYRHRGGRGTVGVNLAKNKTSENASADYATVAQTVAGLADFVTVNVSSPNTPGLRALQTEGELRRIVERVRDTLPPGMALWVKLCPDLGAAARAALGAALATMPVDGIVVANTTVSRPVGLHSPASAEQGGLSGRPLKTLAARALGDIAAASEGKVDLIGVGGIENAEDARQRLEAGAALVQFHTALIYGGSLLPYRIASALARSPATVCDTPPAFAAGARPNGRTPTLPSVTAQ